MHDQFAESIKSFEGSPLPNRSRAIQHLVEKAIGSAARRR
jgi:hypothetical protein